MKIAIIDYGSGNLHSAEKAFEKAAETTGHEVIVTNSSSDVRKASHIVLPGVGAFADCMRGLGKLPGMIKAIEKQVFNHNTPFLGICIGMQLLAQKGYENGEHEGLGWIEGEVIPLEPADETLKIPHMGWNELEVTGSHPIVSGVDPHDHTYFVHSYHMQCANMDNVVAEVGYGDKIVAAVADNNIMGTQFHPEKSQEVGIKVIHNFLMME